MAVDDSLGKIRNREYETLSLSQTIVNYTEGMRKITTENCPEDFSKAFQSHMDAWNAIRRLPISIPTKEAKRTKQGVGEFKKLRTYVWSAWGQVERFTKK